MLRRTEQAPIDSGDMPDSRQVRALAYGELRRQRPSAASSRQRIPLIVRTIGDLEILRNSHAAIRHLPRQGVSVSLSGVAAKESQEFEDSLRAYIRACGCAAGAIAALFGMASVAAWASVSIMHNGLRLGDIGFLLAAVVMGMVLGGIGKALGLTVARIKFVRSCDRILRHMRE
jgi:hypothetical protein